MVNIMPTVQYTAVAIAPPLISNSVTPRDLSARLTDDKEVKIVPKRIKLRMKMKTITRPMNLSPTTLE